MADKDKPSPHEQAATQAAEASEAEQAKIVENVAKREGVHPTPTQHECNMAALGAGVLEKEPDGSPPDPRDPATRKALAAETTNKGGYQTRDAKPAAHTSGSGATHRTSHSPTT